MNGLYARIRAGKLIAESKDPSEHPVRIRKEADTPAFTDVQRFLRQLDDLRRAVLFRVLEATDTGDLEKQLEKAAAQQLEETPSLRDPWRALEKVTQKLTDRFIEETYRLARAAKSPQPRITVAAEPSEWRVRLRPTDATDPVSVVLSATPETVDSAAHPPGCLTPGCGPGPLVWQVAEDAGVPGLVASSGRGRFKILHVSGPTWALFYEHTAGWDELGVGAPEDLKRIAAARAHTVNTPTPVH